MKEQVCFHFKRSQVLPVIQGLLNIAFDYRLSFGDEVIVCVEPEKADLVDYHIQSLNELGTPTEILKREHVGQSMGDGFGPSNIELAT